MRADQREQLQTGFSTTATKAAPATQTDARALPHARTRTARQQTAGMIQLNKCKTSTSLSCRLS